MKKLSLLLILLFLSPSLMAATYYVDFVAGSNSNNGTSTSTPWQHSPGDANATGNAAITLAAGDIVVLKGGVQYNGRIDVNASGGGAGTRITFISGDRHASSWGSGKGIVDGQTTRKWGFYLNGRSWIDIEGLEIRNLGAPTADAAGVYFENAGGAVNNNRVRYCLIHNVNWSAPYVIGYGIENNHGSFHTYEYNEIYNCTDKLIETYGGGTRGTNDSNNNVIRYNVLRNAAVHAVVLTSDDDQFYSNIIFQSHDGTIASSPNPGFCLKVDQGSRNEVFNNICFDASTGFGVLAGDDNLFYSNTVYGLGLNGGGYNGSNNETCFSLQADSHSWTAPVLMRNEFKNNICYYGTPTAGDASYKFLYYENDGGSNNLVQNNLFLLASGDTVSTASRIRRRISGVNSYDSVTTWQSNFNAQFGGSGNSASGNVVSDPSFTGGTLGSLASKPTYFNGTTPQPNGFEIPSGSAAVGIGLTLSSPYDVDMAGRTRTVPFDAGAIEYIPVAPSSGTFRFRRK